MRDDRLLPLPRRARSLVARLNLRRLPGTVRRGQSLVEFALLLPLLMLVVLGGIDFGRAMFSWIQVTNASREAAAYAAFNPNDTGGITLRANQETNVQQQRGEGALDIAVSCARADNGDPVPCSSAFVAGLGSTITVTVSEPFTFFTPLVNNLMPGFALGASSTTFYMVPPNGTGPVPTPTPTASPSPTPSTTPTPDPSATPTPSASPSPTPSPTPSTLCTVPNFVGPPAVRGHSVVSTWTGSGFQAANITNNVNGNSPASQQSLGAGTQQPCFSATIIVQ
jgi:Flp pilus assembly protein TadG